MQFFGSWAPVPILLHFLAAALAQLEPNGLSVSMNMENELGATMAEGNQIQARQAQQCADPGWGRCPRQHNERPAERIPPQSSLARTAPVHAPLRARRAADQLPTTGPKPSNAVPAGGFALPERHAAVPCVAWRGALASPATDVS